MPEFPPNVPSSRCQTVPPLPSHPAVPPEAPSAALPCPPRPALPQPRRRHPSRACDGCGWTQRCSSDSQTTPTNIKKEELKRTPETTLELSRGVCGGTGCGCGARAVLSARRAEKASERLFFRFFDFDSDFNFNHAGQNDQTDSQPARQLDQTARRLDSRCSTCLFPLLHFAHPVFSSVESLVMAPPPPATLPLLERLKMLAQTLQFAWFIGHFTLILAVFRYLLSCITFSTYTTVAQGSYRFAFVAAAATYGIVVYKGYVARGRLGGNIPTDIIKLAGDENVQYLGMALVWLCSRQLLFALLPFAIYSFFHVATYTRTYLIPTFQPSPDAGPASPSGRPAAAKSSPLADQIGRFVKTYYDTSMAMVAALELSLLIRLIFTALTFSSGSWLLLVIYFWFFRSRYTQSSFVQAVVAHSTARIDAMLSHQSTPPAVRQGWEVVKNAVRRLYTVTDLKPYLARFQQQQGPGKKPQ
ncbi:hypothetical protein A7C99_6967 [Trichophyton rubrum]|uniref:Endoplasmic reticulum protein n=3 Tax=Trichophyton TaxID=5550 RepID=A0A178EQW3_TRIRU|nr:hypothetical protein A7C99_6967 [Trichophyton rubrum]